MGKKKTALARPPQRMTKKERSRWQRERRIQRNLIIVFVAIAVISVLVVAYGLYSDMVIEPNRVIAEVNGEPIRLRDYWAARRLELVNDWQEAYNTYQLQIQGITDTTRLQEVTSNFYSNQLRPILVDMGNVRRARVYEPTMQQIIRDTVLIQGARARGIDPTDEEVDAWIFPDTQPPSSPFTGSPTETLPITQTLATPTPASTLTPQERGVRLLEQITPIYEAISRDMKEAAAGDLGFSREDYAGMVRRSARLAFLKEKVQEILRQELPQAEEQVEVWHILVQERLGRAQQARKALEQGKPFPQVVVQFSDDPLTRDGEGARNRAGEMRVTPGDGQLPPQVEAAALAMTETYSIRLVQDEQGDFHLLQFLGTDAATGQVRLRRVLIPAERRSVAEQVLARVQAGEPFAQVARDYSEDQATAGQGGDMYVTKGDVRLSPEVEAAVLALTLTNPLSPIIEDSEGYHLVQLVEGNPATGYFHLRHILVRTGEGLANDLLKRLQSGPTAEFDFSWAVVKYSADQAAVDLAGDIGWVTPGDGQLSPEVEAAALALTPTPTQTHPLSDVIEDAAGYHILKLVERDEAGRMHLCEILIKKAKPLAQEIRAYILAADTREDMVSRFQEMVGLYSDEAQSKANAGSLGWFGRGVYFEIEEAAFSLPVDTIGEVFEGRSGYHLLWVKGHEMAHPIPEERLKTQAEQKYNEWLQGLVEQANIVRYPPSTPTPTPPPPPTKVPVPTIAPPATTVPATATATP